MNVLFLANLTEVAALQSGDNLAVNEARAAYKLLCKSLQARYVARSSGGNMFRAGQARAVAFRNWKSAISRIKRHASA